MTIATLYTNGTIRNAAGKLIGYYDDADKTLVIDGHMGHFKVTDSDHAMDLIGHYVK